MTITFSKYHGTGNDFILIDNRSEQLVATQNELYRHLCSRRFGIGADGLMLVQNHPTCDFEMVYFNADGHLSSMCGNGGRCIVAFAHRLGITSSATTRFMAVDGQHDARLEHSDNGTMVALKMNDVKTVHLYNDNKDYVLDTGSPHYVQFVEDLAQVAVFQEGRAIRNQANFKAEGINVNFVERQKAEHHISVATYERGVENETYSCGTGVVAASIASALKATTTASITITVTTKGGTLNVSFDKKEQQFSNIWLKGAATHVFDGTVIL